MFVACDFHNHSCLSPCGSLEQSPAVLARRARERGLRIVALTDHNTALNTPAFEECARREGIYALFGMELTSSEEVHILCLFTESAAALDFGCFAEEHLLRLPYDPEALGDQVVVDADENVIDLPEIFFGAALDISFDEVCAEGKSRGALVIPAHIDRPMFGAISQLGFLPDGPFDAVEAMRPISTADSKNYPVISGSDAHYPEHIARRPFGLDLPDGWHTGGRVNAEMLKSALSLRAIRLPF